MDDDAADTPITAAAARAGQESHIYEMVAYMSLRSWLGSLSPELATRVASDLGEEVAEDSTLTGAILEYACKHKFILAESAMSFTDDDTDTAHKIAKKTTTGKRRKSEPPKRTKRRALSKRRGTRKSCSDADASADIDVDSRGEGAAIVEKGDEEAASRCHPEVEELFIATGLESYVEACANKGITPERLIVMTPAELKTKLGMQKQESQRSIANLLSIREQLDKPGGRPAIRVSRGPRTKEAMRLIADNAKRDWRAQGKTPRENRAQARNQRKLRPIHHMLPSLRKMPAATAPSFVQATPAGAGASDDAASFMSDPAEPTPPELHSRQSQEPPAQIMQEEEPLQLMTPKQESEEDVEDLYPYTTNDPPSEDY